VVLALAAQSLSGQKRKYFERNVETQSARIAVAQSYTGAFAPGATRLNPGV
jgi:hypothetical protein